MQRTNPLQNSTADEEQGALLAARQADGDAIQRNGFNIRTHAAALKRHRPVWFGLPCTSCALTSTSSASVILHSLLTRTPRPCRSRNCSSTLNLHLISDNFLIRTLRISAALANCSPYKRIRLIKGFVRDLNPCWNLVVGLLALAMTWGCPALDASVATGQLTVNPTTIGFGEVLVGNSQTQSGTLTNSNGTDLIISQVWVSGSGFQLSGLGLPLSLAPGQSATFNVTFTPTTSGSVVGAISVIALVSSSEDSNINYNSPLSIPLSGTGISPPSVLQPTSSSLSFGSVQVGNSTTQSETLTNSGGSSVSITQANLSGSAFSVSGLNLPLTLIPEQSFTFDVVFAPNSAGSVTGSISVVSNASNSTLIISLGGTGTAAGQLVVTPTTLDFGSIVVGTSTSLPATLSATGSSVTVSSATSNSSEFTLSGLSFPVTLAAGQSASFTFTFRPQASGTDTASISFISNASNSPTVESLTGSGVLSPLHSVDLSWSPSTSAVVGYNVYRSGASDGPYAKINSALNAATAYTDNTVQAGVTYYYVTTAVDASGVESVYSNQAQAVVPTP
jgi:hypothetical protein